jgi:hypothetical protein
VRAEPASRVAVGALPLLSPLFTPASSGFRASVASAATTAPPLLGPTTQPTRARAATPPQRRNGAEIGGGQGEVLDWATALTLTHLPEGEGTSNLQICGTQALKFVRMGRSFSVPNCAVVSPGCSSASLTYPSRFALGRRCRCVCARPSRGARGVRRSAVLFMLEREVLPQASRSSVRNTVGAGQGGRFPYHGTYHPVRWM